MLFEIYLIDNKENRDILNLYKELMNINDFLNNEIVENSNLEYINFIQEKLNDILKEDISKGNIKKEALEFITTFICTADGMLLYSFTLKNFNLQKEYSNFLNNFIKLVRIEK
ncbi:MAG: hypothetical protein ACERKK_11825 [Poseidonibacter sp.]|uniref:hypothetical protein n=1 Tax=Poseidonibacter sp. TaxID=2321188 RepID=UPI00359CE946